jgi:hypothetical protein
VSLPRTLTAFSVLLLGACRTMGATEDIPARIVDADEASHAALQEAVNRATGREVLLAGDALTDSSILTIEHRQPATMQNPLPQGRVMEMPVRFQLVRHGDDCVLVDTRDASRHLLDDTRCVAE